MDEPRSEKRHLSVGDRIQGYPCVVTILHVGETSAYGRCSTCRERHIIDRGRYESGRGPWRPLRLLSETVLTA